MQQWFNNLTRQEQLMLLLVSLVLVLYLLFVLVLRPQSAAIASMQTQNQLARESLAAVQQLAAEYKVLEKTSAASTGVKQNLTRLIDSSVKNNQLTMNRFQPSSSGDVQVRFENAVYNNVLAWLNQLENEHGLLIKDLSITTGAAPGLVNVSVRLRQGA